MARMIIALLLVLGGNSLAAAQPLEGVMLRYMVSEQGQEPYPSRIIVTDTMVRMDDGEAGGDYLLFDRNRQLISSVTHEDGTILEIPQREITMPSRIALKRDRTLERDDKAPPIGGRQPHQLRLFVNDKLCFDAVVVPGLLRDVVKALKEFGRVLAGEQGKMIAELPSDMIDGCDLALHTFHPEWPLESGLAIQSYDAALRQGQLLVDVDQEFSVEPSLFELPADYRRYRTP